MHSHIRTGVRTHTHRQMDMTSSTQVLMLIKNIYALYGEGYASFFLLHTFSQIHLTILTHFQWVQIIIRILSMIQKRQSDYEYIYINWYIQYIWIYARNSNVPKWSHCLFDWNGRRGGPISQHQLCKWHSNKYGS